MLLVRGVKGAAGRSNRGKVEARNTNTHPVTLPSSFPTSISPSPHRSPQHHYRSLTLPTPLTARPPSSEHGVVM
ncbi:hypothetical protein E2C01_070245 [Portunus trituberculatus]|uniref:Uncharacterized protein n=1 Tax=Portunus trituberculatus TaxID=210409 RepID=A0A5B7I4K6_PORTR|nr:hypothetical protein [Portunus trituberculatus]